jgi:hypothetical protein
LPDRVLAVYYCSAVVCCSVSASRRGPTLAASPAHEAGPPRSGALGRLVPGWHVRCIQTSELAAPAFGPAFECASPLSWYRPFRLLARGVRAFWGNSGHFGLFVAAVVGRRVQYCALGILVPSQLLGLITSGPNRLLGISGAFGAHGIGARGGSGDHAAPCFVGPACSGVSVPSA